VKRKEQIDKLTYKLKPFSYSKQNSEKSSTLDFIPGGRGEGKLNKDFDPKQLSMGKKVEMEHTHDPNIALEISRDHLQEYPDYYDRLEQMERAANKYWHTGNKNKLKSYIKDRIK
jgi:hypothetical protein